jgi:hypothetical protein
MSAPSTPSPHRLSDRIDGVFTAKGDQGDDEEVDFFCSQNFRDQHDEQELHLKPQFEQQKEGVFETTQAGTPNVPPHSTTHMCENDQSPGDVMFSKAQYSTPALEDLVPEYMPVAGFRRSDTTIFNECFSDITPCDFMASAVKSLRDGKVSPMVVLRIKNKYQEEVPEVPTDLERHMALAKALFDEKADCDVARMTNTLMNQGYSMDTEGTLKVPAKDYETDKKKMRAREKRLQKRVRTDVLTRPQVRGLGLRGNKIKDDPDHVCLVLQSKARPHRKSRAKEKPRKQQLQDTNDVLEVVV